MAARPAQTDVSFNQQMMHEHSDAGTQLQEEISSVCNDTGLVKRCTDQAGIKRLRGGGRVACRQRKWCCEFFENVVRDKWHVSVQQHLTWVQPRTGWQVCVIWEMSSCCLIVCVDLHLTTRNK